MFPLPDHVFEEMLADMPRGHKSLFDSLVLTDNDPDLVEEEEPLSYPPKTDKAKQRRTTNNNSISYQDEEHLDELDDDDSDRNSIVERLLLLEKAYDAEKNNQDYSAAETESVDTDDIPEEEIEDPNDPEWLEPVSKF